MVDKDGWHLTNNGKFTVKSKYQVERVYRDREQTPVGYGPTVDILKVFRLKVRCPPKIKAFFMAIDIRMYSS